MLTTTNPARTRGGAAVIRIADGHREGNSASRRERRAVSGDIHAQVAGREGEVLGLLGIDPGPPRGARHRPCPFPDHDDAHPSWRWDAGKRRWFCTCAEKGGTVLDAVMRMRGLDF